MSSEVKTVDLIHYDALVELAMNSIRSRFDMAKQAWDKEEHILQAKRLKLPEDFIAQMESDLKSEMFCVQEFERDYKQSQGWPSFRY